MIWNLSASYRLEAATGRGINKCSSQRDIEAWTPVPVGIHLALHPETHIPPAPMHRAGPDHTALPELNVEPFPKRKQNVPAALKLRVMPEPFQHCLANNATRPLGATPDQQGISTSPIRRTSLDSSGWQSVHAVRLVLCYLSACPAEYAPHAPWTGLIGSPPHRNADCYEAPCTCSPAHSKGPPRFWTKNPLLSVPGASYQVAP